MRPMSPIRSTLLALLSLCGPATQAGEHAPYPIWWSPTLELESLEKIGERLERKFWPHGDGIPVVKGEWPGDAETFIDSCASYEKLTNDGYYASNTLNDKVLMFNSSFCHALEMLASAKPSLISFIGNITLSPGIVDYLPAMVESGISCDMQCRLVDANVRCVPWSMFGVSRLDASKFKSIDVLNQYKMDVITDTTSLTLEIMARADFNDDGTEDLLLWVNETAIEGNWDSTNVIALTRETADGVLWALNAERSLCSSESYTCEKAYGFSRNSCKAD